MATATANSSQRRIQRAPAKTISSLATKSRGKLSRLKVPEKKLKSAPKIDYWERLTSSQPQAMTDEQSRLLLEDDRGER